MVSNFFSDIISSVRGLAEQTLSHDWFGLKTIVEELSEGIDGGPHNLGDPEDTSIRPVEGKVITYMAWHIIKNVKCRTEEEAYIEHCHACENSDKCLQARTSLSACLKEYYENRFEEVEAECTATYLEVRREYRQTADRQHLEKVISMMPLHVL